MFNQTQIQSAIQATGHLTLDDDHTHVEVHAYEGVLAMLVVRDGAIVFDGYTDMQRVFNVAKTLH